MRTQAYENDSAFQLLIEGMRTLGRSEPLAEEAVEWLLDLRAKVKELQSDIASWVERDFANQRRIAELEELLKLGPLEQAHKKLAAEQAISRKLYDALKEMVDETRMADWLQMDCHGQVKDAIAEYEGRK